jgi:hypothetical protein
VAALASTALLLAGVASTGSAQAQSPGGLITYAIEFSNPYENDNNDLPEPYGQVYVSESTRHTTLWEHPDLDINTPTLPRYPMFGTTHRYADHSISELCAFVGEDDTGINADDILANGCVPFHGPGFYTIPGPYGGDAVNVLVYDID